MEFTKGMAYMMRIVEINPKFTLTLETIYDDELNISQEFDQMVNVFNEHVPTH
jgi:hypothetical protein